MTVSQVNVWADRVMYYSLLPLAFFLPISTAAIEITATFCISAFFIKRIILFFLNFKSLGMRKTLSTMKTVPHFLVLPVVFFIYATLLSVLASQFPHLSWKGFFGKTVESVVLFFAVVETMNTRQRLNTFISLFSLSTILIAINGIWQRYAKKDLIFGHVFTSDERVTSCFGHPNDFAAYMIVGSMLFIGLLVWSWTKRDHRQASPDLFVQGMLRVGVIGAGILLSVSALGWTFSRGAWLGFTVAFLILVFWDRRKWYVPITILLVFWVVFSAQIGTVRNVSFITDDISMDGRKRVKLLAEHKEQVKKTEFQLSVEEIPTLMSRFTGGGRQVFWTESLQVFKASPIFGTGLNTFSDAAKRYIPNWSGYYSHNCYLQMLAEIGLLGLGSFFWLMFVLSREVWRSFSQIADDYYRALLIALFSGLAGFWVHSFFDTNFYSSRLGNMMWIIMGLIVVVILISRQDKGSDASRL